MYVTFGSTSTKEQSLLIPPLSESIVKGILRNKVNNVKNMMLWGNIVNRFITYVVSARTLVTTVHISSIVDKCVRCSHKTDNLY